jgi:hypothetical protein
MAEDVRCPNPACTLPNDVQKVSDTIQGGLPHRIETLVVGSDSNTNGQLAAPAPPRKGARWGCVVSGVLVIAVFGLCSAANAILYTFNPGSIAAVKGTAPDPPALAALALGSLALAAWILVNKFVEAARYKRELPAWSRAQAIWGHLYYCNRCGSVFDPTEGDTFVPASHMRELLA